MFALPLLAVLVQTLSGSPVDALEAPTGTKAIVFLFVSTDCPISNRYAPEIRRLAGEFASRRVVFRLIYPGRADTAAAIRKHLTEYGYGDIVSAYRDPQLALAKFVGATVTPEAAVLVDGRVVYKGRIDDRYVELGVDRPSATTADLGDAVTAALEGKSIAHPITQAVGCFIADLAR